MPGKILFIQLEKLCEGDRVSETIQELTRLLTRRVLSFECPHHAGTNKPGKGSSKGSSKAKALPVAITEHGKHCRRGAKANLNGEFLLPVFKVKFNTEARKDTILNEYNKHKICFAGHIIKECCEECEYNLLFTFTQFCSHSPLLAVLSLTVHSC